MCHVLLITSMPAKTTVISFTSLVSHAIYIWFLFAENERRPLDCTLLKTKSELRVGNGVGNS
jgi:hypothetical protein